MRWYEFANNPLAISSLYKTVPSLDVVHVKSVVLGQRRDLEITTDLHPLPAIIPRRWTLKGYTNVWLKLHFFSIQAFHYFSQFDDEVVSFSISKGDHGLLDVKMTSSKGDTMEAIAFCFNIILIKS